MMKLVAALGLGLLSGVLLGAATASVGAALLCLFGAVALGALLRWGLGRRGAGRGELGARQSDEIAGRACEVVPRQ